MFLRLICGLLSLSAVSGLNCSCSGYYKKSIRKDDSMVWFNTIVSSWYLTQQKELFDIVQGLINDNVNTYLPSWIASLNLKKLNLGAGRMPSLDHVKSHVDTVYCKEGTLTRYTLDIAVHFESATSVAEVDLELLLGDIGISVDQVLIMGTIRVELVMNSGLGLPGLSSATVTMLGRPNVEFNVELFGAIGADTFGLRGLIQDAVEDVIQEELVYPGMLYINLANLSSIDTVLIANDPDLHPAILAAKVTIVPLGVTIGKDFTVYFEYNDGDTQAQAMGNEGRYQFDALYDSFDYPQVDVYVVTYFGEVARATVDVQMLLRSDYTSENHTFRHHQGSKASWGINIQLSAYLLPMVPILQQGTKVKELGTMIHEASCVTCGEKGVLYIHIHSGANLTVQDTSTSDPYVYIYVNGKRMGHTETASSTLNPVWDKKLEVILKEDTPLNKQFLRFAMFDQDTFSADENMGSVKIPIQKKAMINKGLALLSKRGSNMGTLYVSVIFRAVPFL